MPVGLGPPLGLPIPTPVHCEIGIPDMSLSDRRWR